jgi:hypothetical protein
MAVNDFDSMNEQFAQGTVDSTYISIAPDRKNVENPPLDRLTWLTYGQAEKHVDPPHLEAHIQHALRPVEYKTRNTGDPRV